MEIELRKCPFCGYEKVTIKNIGGIFVKCNKCCASTRNYPTEAEAISAWNVRFYHSGDSTEMSEKYNILKNDYDILQAQYQMALKAVMCKHEFSNSKIDLEERRWQAALAIVAANESNSHQVIIEWDRNLLIANAIDLADKLVNQFKQQSDER